MARLKQNNVKQGPKQESRGNQKNNWTLEKRGITQNEFSKLRGTLFKQAGSSGAWRLAKPKVFKFAAIAYFYYDVNEEKGSPPLKLERVVRIFVQLSNRLYFDDVENGLGMTGLVEWEYDKLNPDRSAVDAAKACYAVIGNCQSWVAAGDLTLKGAKSRVTPKSPIKVARGRGTRRQSGSEDDSTDPSNPEEEFGDSNEEDDDEVSGENWEKNDAFSLESDDALSPRMREAKKRKQMQKKRDGKKQKRQGEMGEILSALKNQSKENQKIYNAFKKIAAEVEAIKKSGTYESSANVGKPIQVPFRMPSLEDTKDNATALKKCLIKKSRLNVPSEDVAGNRDLQLPEDNELKLPAKISHSDVHPYETSRPDVNSKGVGEQLEKPLLVESEIAATYAEDEQEKLGSSDVENGNILPNTEPGVEKDDKGSTLSVFQDTAITALKMTRLLLRESLRQTTL